MSDRDRTKHGSGRRPAPDREQSTSSAPAKVVPSWRRRLYRVPLLGAIVYLIWPPRTKSPSIPRRMVSWTSAVAVLLGLGMVGYPWVGTSYPTPYRVPVETLIAWSNFLSDWRANNLQDQLAKDFAMVEDITAAGDGDPITQLSIPSLGVDTIVVEGTSPSALKAGAGHYPNTPLPGNKGNVAIAGHRTTYGRPFHKIDRLKPGDHVVLTTPVGRFTYEVVRPPWTTDPYDWSVIDQGPEHTLTLTSCHPLGSARERLVVRAHLVATEPVPAPAEAA